MVKIGYDAGHGLNTAGKRTPDGEPEWTFNNKVARAFASELAMYQDVTVRRFDDSTGRRDVPLIERTNGANSWGANYYISFHHNALSGNWGNWTGVETYVYLGNRGSVSGKLAEAIHPAVVRSYGLKDRGIKEANFHILRETRMPAILIEGGFMDSLIDIKKLRDDKVLENAGIQIARALAQYLGLKKAERGLTMDQYNELKKLIENQNRLNQAQAKEIAELKNLVGLTDTGRTEVKQLIEKACNEGIFNKDYHYKIVANGKRRIDTYTDKQLISYLIAYVNRKAK